MNNDLGVLVRNANPVLTTDHLTEEEFSAALMAIETSLAEHPKTRRLPSFFHGLRTRPTLVFATAAVVVAMIIAVPLLLFATRQGEVTEPTTVTTTVAPTTTTVATTTTTVTTTSVPTTTAAPAIVIPPAPEITWTRVPHQPAFDSAEIGGWGAALIQGGPGLVGTGHVWSGLENLHAAMFVSADGMSWDRIDDPWMEEGPNTNMVDVASGPGGTLVAAGGDGSDAGIWVSEDGLSWSQVTSDVLGGADVQAILGVVAGGPGFVAVGDDGSHAGVWVSPDGYGWSKVEDADLLAGDDLSVSMYDVVVGGPGLVAVGSAGLWDVDTAPAVWVSVDGFDWHRLPGETFATESGDFGFQSGTRDPDSGRLIGFGSQMWTSRDGYDWVPVDGDLTGAPPPGAEVAWSGGTAVAAGQGMSLSLLVSGDGGSTWVEIDANHPEFEGYWPQAQAVTEWEGRFIVAGQAGDYLSEVGAVWIGTPEE